MTMQGPRAARREEIPAVIELADSVFRAEREGSMGQQFPLLYAEQNAENLRIFADDGAPVSLVGMVEVDVLLQGGRHTACEIGSVCTHPDYRGQGLATRLLHDARAKARQDGCDLFLISGGRGLYRRQGFVDVGGYFHAAIDRKRLPEAGPWRIEPWEEDDLPALIDLHVGEPTRFERPPEDFLTLLRKGCIMDRRAETRLVRPRTGEPVAYLSYIVPGEGDLGEDEIRIEEMAGSRRAVAEALPAVFEEYDLQTAHAKFLRSDTEARALAGSLGWRTQPAGFHGTVGIICPALFWRNARPLLRERIGPQRFGRLSFTADGDGTRIAFGDESTDRLDMSELTRLVFLPADRRDELDLPRDTELGRLLDRLFPLPLVAYGLNYV
ncbi:MAG: GNAT family N-acetyltransferase [Planctomycetota bacterium]